MATITRCDRCGTLDAPTEQLGARGVRLDLCEKCAGEVLSPWADEVVAAAAALPTVPRRPGPREPRVASAAPAAASMPTTRST